MIVEIFSETKNGFECPFVLLKTAKLHIWLSVSCLASIFNRVEFTTHRIPTSTEASLGLTDCSMQEMLMR